MIRRSLIAGSLLGSVSPSSANNEHAECKQCACAKSARWRRGYAHDAVDLNFGRADTGLRGAKGFDYQSEADDARQVDRDRASNVAHGLAADQEG